MPAEDLIKALSGRSIDVGGMLNAGVTEATPGLKELMVELVSGFEGRPKQTGSTVLDGFGNVQDMRVGLNATETEPGPKVKNIIQRIMHEITHGITGKEEFFPENVGKQMEGQGFGLEEGADLDEATATLFEEGRNTAPVAQTRSVAFGGGTADRDMERSLFDALMTMMLEIKNAE